MIVDTDFRGVFLAMVTVGGPIALICWLVGLYLMQRQDRKQQGQQRAREFRQDKRRLRVGRGSS